MKLICNGSAEISLQKKKFNKSNNSRLSIVCYIYKCNSLSSSFTLESQRSVNLADYCLVEVSVNGL